MAQVAGFLIEAALEALEQFSPDEGFRALDKAPGVLVARCGAEVPGDCVCFFHDPEGRFDLYLT